MKFTRKAQLALTAVAAAAPLALALPAQASTTTGLCTVTPWVPFFDHLDSSGQKVISYGTTVYCPSGRSIEIQEDLSSELGTLPGAAEYPDMRTLSRELRRESPPRRRISHDGRGG